MEWLDSEKRKQMLSLEGYMYVKQKVLAGGIVSYECKERRSGRCKAKVKVLGDEIVGRTHEHTHAPDGRKVEAKRAAQEIRQRAEDTRETPQQLITAAVGMLSQGASTQLPAVRTMRRNIRRYRQAAGATPPLPESAAAMDILEELKKTLKGKHAHLNNCSYRHS